MSLSDVPAPAGTSLPAVAAPTSAAATGSAQRWPVVVLLVLGAICMVAVVPLFRNGVVTHAFPSYIRDDPAYTVQRWSAPWVGGALAVGGLGVTCWAIAGGLLARARRPPATRPAPVGTVVTGTTDSAGLAPRPTEAAHEY